MLKLSTENHKVEDIFNMALTALTKSIVKHDEGYNSPVSAQETYQLLCTRELVRGMVAARLLAESLSNPMQKDDIHQLASSMLDTLTHLYPTMGLAGSVNEALEELSKMSSVSAWKIHSRMLNLFKPSKKERPFPIPFWPSSAFNQKAAA